MRKSFQYNNTTLVYTVEGQGSPVVLLHGFGEDSTVWDEQLAFLQPHFRVMVPDLPGTGGSSLLTPQNMDTPVSIDDYADCIAALLDHEEIAECALLGHSMGGYITLAFAEKYPNRLTRFGLVHSTAFADSEEKKKSREKSIGTIEEYGAAAFLRSTIPNLFGAGYKNAHPHKVEALITAGGSFSREVLQQYTKAMMRRPDRTHVLLSNSLPVLFVIGTEDIAAPLADLMKQVSLPLNSYIHVLPGVGHMGMWEATDLVNSYLLSFLNG